MYSRADFRSSVVKTLNCGVSSASAGQSSTSAARTLGTCELRSYRLCVAGTGEYTQFHGGTVALAAAAITTRVRAAT